MEVCAGTLGFVFTSVLFDDALDPGVPFFFEVFGPVADLFFDRSFVAIYIYLIIQNSHGSTLQPAAFKTYSLGASRLYSFFERQIPYQAETWL